MTWITENQPHLMLNAKGGHDHCGVGIGVLAAVKFLFIFKVRSDHTCTRGSSYQLTLATTTDRFTKMACTDATGRYFCCLLALPSKCWKMAWGTETIESLWPRFLSFPGIMGKTWLQKTKPKQCSSIGTQPSWLWLVHSNSNCNILIYVWFQPQTLCDFWLTDRLS